MAQGGGAMATTKSIDVGGVFLMDLSVSEALEPPDCELPSQRQQHNQQQHHEHRPLQPSRAHNNHNHLQQIYDTTKPPGATSQHALYRKQPHLTQQQQQQQLLNSRPLRSSPAHQFGGNNLDENAHQSPPPPARPDYFGSSFDRLASVINCDGHAQVGPRQQVAAAAAFGPRDEEEEDAGDEHFREPLSSLSDESYVPSSGTSLSVSHTGSSEDGGEPCRELELELDRQSTNTREDSGVLDMKDLEGNSLKSGAQGEGDQQQRRRQQQQVPRSLERADDQQQQQNDWRAGDSPREKSISANIMATNLIITKQQPASANVNSQYQQQQAANSNINYGAGDSTHTQTQTHNHQGRRADARRSVSASLPIQVPARQMKKNLNRMKLKLTLMKQSEQEQQVAAPGAPAPELAQQQQADLLEEPALVRRGDRNRPALENMAAFCCGDLADEHDAFLDQEFNANHQNHYPVDELDREHLTAGEDPMRLFASIQALAKSLHEDAELFGSLPPKRMLESPIRSLALV